MSYIYLKPGKEDSLRRFHPWVFSGAIARRDADIQEGETVDVLDSKGAFIARGHFQIGSIMVRCLTFDEQEAIDLEFFKKKLSAALEVRKALGLWGRTDNTTFRLVHGEGDGLSGLVVDIYSRTAVMQAHSVGMHLLRQMIATALSQVLAGYVDHIYYKSETTLPFKASLEQENGFLMGGSDDNIALENGLKFHIDWLKGQKTGFFVDQRENRSLLEQYAKGRDLLNMFCYTGGFSVYALRGGARKVDSVDSSGKAIELTKGNVDLNFPGDTRHKGIQADAFKFLDQMEKDAYDLIILDPPAFAKHRDALRNALQGYRRINQKAFEKIRPGGILFTFSCSQAVNKDQFRLAVFSAAAASGRSVRILHQLTQPKDHPISIYHPEGEYLKGLVLYVE